MAVLLARAREHADWPMPGYTHLQRAQPVYLGHHLLAYFWMLDRDRQRFAFARAPGGRLPLGAGALAGVNFDTDRELLARASSASRRWRRTRSTRSPAATSCSTTSSAAATCATHLSRLGAELVLWSSSEFGFCELPDAWSSGSSIMPQKKNPDAAELLRAKAPRLVGHLAALHGVIHALPLTYNKDLQEDKEHLFDAADTLELILAAARGHARGRRASTASGCAAAASDELIAATDVADLLVRLGMPFREAHGVVAGLVRTARRLRAGRSPSSSGEELAAQSELLAGHAQRVPRGARVELVARVEGLGGRNGLGAARRADRAGRAGAGWSRSRLTSTTARCCRSRRSWSAARVVHGETGGRDRRDRGLPRERAGVPRLRRADAADPHAVRPARPRLRVPLLRDPRAAERGVRAGGGGGGGADPRAGAGGAGSS